MARQNLGKVAVVFRGEYNSSTTYDNLDIVTYDGSSYECKNDNTVGILPTNSTYWNIVAQKGYDPVRGTDYWTNQDKEEVTTDAITQVEEDIEPTITAIETTANTANTTANTANNTANTAKSIAQGANQALSYNNYSSMITILNAFPMTKYRVGQNIYIVTQEVPDLWVSSVKSTSSTYTYTTDDAFISELKLNGYVQVGYYRLSMLETQKVDLTDYYTKTQTDSLVNVKENSSNKVTSMSATSTDTQYPSAKAVWDLFNSIVDGNEVSY